MQELVIIYKKFVSVNRRERLAGRDRKAELVQTCSKTLSTVVLLDSCLWVPKKPQKVNLHITHLMVQKKKNKMNIHVQGSCQTDKVQNENNTFLSACVPLCSLMRNCRH